jgi:hypothetical protein
MAPPFLILQGGGQTIILEKSTAFLPASLHINPAGMLSFVFRNITCSGIGLHARLPPYIMTDLYYILTGNYVKLNLSSRVITPVFSGSIPVT